MRGLNGRGGINSGGGSKADSNSDERNYPDFMKLMPYKLMLQCPEGIIAN